MWFCAVYGANGFIVKALGKYQPRVIHKLAFGDQHSPAKSGKIIPGKDHNKAFLCYFAMLMGLELTLSFGVKHTFRETDVFPILPA